MKKRKADLFCFIICIFLLPRPRAQAQWIPGGPPHWVQTEISTVGGITYFQGESSMDQWCNRLAAYRVSREGTNLSLPIQQEVWTGICVCDAVECGPAPNQRIASVLGALEPGDYSLTIWSTNQVSFPRTTSSVRSFTVPTNGTPTLAISRGTGESVQVHVEGIPNIQYVLQGSMDLTNWTSLRTNIGAPITFLHSNAVQRFYRTAVVPLPRSE